MARIDNLNNFLTDVADAIREKKGSADPIVIADFDTEIENLPGGGLTEKDVNFYDYDGTLTNSYTKQEFLALTAMPANPSHPGLTAQGWNWSLSDAQTYVSNYNILDIGQTYVTDDDTTRIYINLTKGYLNPFLGLGINGTIEVDWGDQTSSSITGTSIDTLIYTQHVYAQPGEYVISIGGTGSIQIFSSGNLGYSLLTKQGALTSVSDPYPYNTNIIKIECGNNVSIGEHAFWNCFNLKTITLSSSVTTIGSAAFAICYHLKSIVFPPTLETIGANAFQSCGLINVLFSKDLLSIEGQAFYSCYLLNRVTLPNNDNIVYGTGAFQYCYSLSKVVAPSGSLGTYTFSNCASLVSAVLGQKILYLDNYLFSGCTGLHQIEIFTNTLTTSGNGLFNGCRSLARVNLPTQLVTLSTNIFSNCYALPSIMIPSSVMTINAGAFGNCYCLMSCDFSEHTAIPTLANTSAFNNMAPNGKIIVPDNLYNDWIAASNWSNSGIVNRIIKKSDWDAL